MPIDLPPGHFFLPGPTEVHPEVLAAQTRPMIGHRGRGIEELLAGLQEGLKRVFLTEQPVIVSTSSATGLMEASVRNGVAGGRVLSMVNGAFSSRFSEIAMACGHDTEVWSVEWGQVHDVGELDTRLAQGDFDAVTMTHSETSTGALQDLPRSPKSPGFMRVMLLIDSVTGVAGVEVRTDDWGLDFVLTGSQKALALPRAWLSPCLAGDAGSVGRGHGQGLLLRPAASDQVAPGVSNPVDAGDLASVCPRGPAGANHGRGNRAALGASRCDARCDDRMGGYHRAEGVEVAVLAPEDIAPRPSPASVFPRASPGPRWWQR